MNIYRAVGDLVGTPEARDLAARLLAWHDAMVQHARATEARRAGCGEDCPHEQARVLWTAAVAVFGHDATRLAFLRTHGQHDRFVSMTPA